MSNELATLSGLTGLAVPAGTTSTDLSAYSTGIGEFLQNIRLFGKGEHVETGKIPPGHYGVQMSGEGNSVEIIDLGETIDVLLFASRDKALDYGIDPPVVCYDKTNEVFIDIKERAEAEKMKSKCLYGPSILLYERKSKKLYEWFLINTSSREEAKKLRPFFPVWEEDAKLFGVEPHPPIPCTLGAKFIKRKKGSWYIPTVTRCSTPFTELPPNEVLAENITKFVTAKANTPDLVEEDGARDV